MFFFFPFYGGGGFFFLLLLLLVARVLRNLFRNDNRSDDYTHYYYYNFSNGQGNTNTNNPGSTRSTADYYKVLGLTPQATEAEIKKAYRKLILEYHPDTVASKEGLSEESKKYATKKFREVQEAYEQICRERGIK